MKIIAKENLSSELATRPSAREARSAQRAGSVVLGNTRITFPVSSTRAFRYKLREEMRNFTKLRSVKKCGAVPIHSVITLHSADEGHRAGYGGLHTCGSIWACPVCSAKISARRNQEVSEVISQAIRQNKHVSMLTLTQRHNASQGLTHLWDALSKAWNTVTSGRRWQFFKEQLGLIGYIRSVEVTHGKNGWHVHTHILIISDIDPSQALFIYQRKQGRRKTPYPKELMRPSTFIAERWAKGLAKSGIDFIENQGGLDWRTAKKGDEAELGRYVAKLGISPCQPDNLAKEMTLGGFKKAKKENRTPFQILEDFLIYGDMEDLEIWNIWEKCSHSRRALNWSKGLRDWANLGKELTDEEIAAEKAGDKAIAIFNHCEFKKVRRAGAGELLDVLEYFGKDAVYKWLQKRKIRYEISDN